MFDALQETQRITIDDVDENRRIDEVAGDAGLWALLTPRGRFLDTRRAKPWHPATADIIIP
jgi:hypothetical protein